MIHKITITTGAFTYNTVKCSCGFVKETSFGAEADLLARKHVRENPSATIFETNPGNPIRTHHTVMKGHY